MIDLSGFFQAVSIPQTATISLWPMIQTGAALVIVGLQTWVITTVRDLRDEVRRLNHHIFGVQGNNGLTSQVVKLWSDQDRQDDNHAELHDCMVRVATKLGVEGPRR